jgi:circadian clock protein KaiB
MTSRHDSTLRRYEAEIAVRDLIQYELTLFVTGASDLSARAIANARQLCDTHLSGRANLLVVDVHANLDALLASGVVATPTLVKTFPLPLRRIVGDLSHTDKVLRALDLPIVTQPMEAVG